MKQYIQKINKYPDIFLVKLPIKSDYVFLDISIPNSVFWENKNQIGISHLLEHYICESLFSKFEDKFSINGRVNYRELNLHFEFKKSVFEKLSIPLLESVFNPKISEEILNKEKCVITDEISNSIKKTNHKLFELSLKTAFENPERLKYSIIGNAKDIQEINGNVLSKFWFDIIDGHSKIYNPDDIISIVKSIKSADINRMAKLLDFSRANFIVIGNGVGKSIKEGKILELIRQ